MSSATSTEDHGLPSAAPAPRGEDAGLHPWQFFLLAGMLSATGVVLVATGQSPASIIVLSLTVIAASIVALATYRSFAPLVVPQPPEAAPLVGSHIRTALEREKMLVLRAIKDLEFDFAMKKIAQADFDEMGARLRARAIGLMRQLDEGGGYRAEIERELQRRAHLSATGATGLSTEARSAQLDLSTEARSAQVGLSTEAQSAEVGLSTEAQSAQLDLSTEARSAKVDATNAVEGACACGTVNDPDARFCKNCGSQLAVA